MPDSIKTSPIEIYQTQNGESQVEVRFDNDTVWLSQAQMAQVFDKNIRTVNEHIINVFEEHELDKEATIRKFRIVRQEGNRQVEREIEHYNLDMIISVGYRVKSQQGVAFRRWATARLKDYLLKGYAINQQRFHDNAVELEQALQLIQKTAKSPDLTLEGGRGLVDIVSRYTQTFLWLQQYDEGLLSEPKSQTGGVLPTVAEACQALATLKAELIAKGEATPLFAQERGDGLPALLGNLEQSVFGEPAYPSIEAKASHLLYFVIKITHLRTVTNAVGHFYLLIFYTKMGDYLTAKMSQLSMTQA